MSPCLRVLTSEVQSERPSGSVGMGVMVGDGEVKRDQAGWVSLRALRMVLDPMASRAMSEKLRRVHPAGLPDLVGGGGVA